jgi:hypothetical protein
VVSVTDSYGRILGFVDRSRGLIRQLKAWNLSGALEMLISLGVEGNNLIHVGKFCELLQTKGIKGMIGVFPFLRIIQNMYMRCGLSVEL